MPSFGLVALIHILKYYYYLPSLIHPLTSIMALVSFSPISANTITCSTTTRQISHINTLHRANNAFGNFHPPIVPVIQTRQKQLLVVPISRATNSPEAAGGGGDGDGDGDGQDPRALETVLKLYSAIKNKNVRELSEIIGDECQCVCNLSPIIQPLRGKKVDLPTLIHFILNLLLITWFPSPRKEITWFF